MAAAGGWWTAVADRVPGARRVGRLPGQVVGRNPFAGGSIVPTRVRVVALGAGRPALPFPHPWNYREPLRILETFFWGAEGEEGTGRHNRYLEVAGFAPVLVTRDPRVIRAISAETGEKAGQFDRDTMPSVGIARATGRDTLLYANGAMWKRQKKLATPPFARTTLFRPEQFREFAETCRETVRARLGALKARVEREGEPVRVELEGEIKALMLEMLVVNFFGARVSQEEIRGRYVVALERVIDHIVRDTVINRVGVPLGWVPGVLGRRVREAKEARAVFEELTGRVLAQRRAGTGLWGQFKSDAPDEALRGNIRVFLAGALEATTSYAGWAISHLARDAAAQERVYEEVKGIEDYTPEALEGARYLGHVLNETLRLTPSLYFHPRRATCDTWVEVGDGERLFVPRGAHVLLDVWHANRHEDHWGVGVTGHPAGAFVPERWEGLAERPGGKELLHLGFGHGPRFCRGKSLGQLEVALVVGACVKVFRFGAVKGESGVRAGVSTKPGDGVGMELRVREGVGGLERTR